MRPRSPKTPNVRASARVFLAAALAFAVAAGVVPLGSVLGAGGCSMPCCKSADGTPGDCEGGSCPVTHLGKAKPKQVELLHPDSSHHAGEESVPHGGAADSHHAEHHSSHGQDADRIEHSAHRHVSPRDTSTEPAVTSSALSNPCPPDCGGVLNAPTQLRRSRDEAALSHKLRPRPTSAEAYPQAPPGVTKTSSALRRQYPPRAPPTVPASRPA